MKEVILHATPGVSWSAAQVAKTYRSESLETEGFIHCSKPGQILRVANFLYKGQTGLVLLVIDPQYLTAELKWEPPVHTSHNAAPPPDELFPHLYGPLNLEAVVDVLPFKPGADGTFTLPDSLRD